MKTIICVLDEIDRLRLKRNWSMHELSLHTGIPQSTISTWYRKHQQPSIASLRKICEGFGVTMSQFFAEEEEMALLTEDERELLDTWAAMTEQQQEAFLALIIGLNEKNKPPGSPSSSSCLDKSS